MLFFTFMCLCFSSVNHNRPKLLQGNTKITRPTRTEDSGANRTSYSMAISQNIPGNLAKKQFGGETNTEKGPILNQRGDEQAEKSPLEGEYHKQLFAHWNLRNDDSEINRNDN